MGLFPDVNHRSDKHNVTISLWTYLKSHEHGPIVYHKSGRVDDGPVYNACMAWLNNNEYAGLTLEEFLDKTLGQ